jgi:thioredoxin-related protein
MQIRFQHELGRVSSAICLLFFAVLPASALELVMFERSGCVWCLRWDREVSAGYSASSEGQRAPLRRVSLDREMTGARPEDIALTPPVFYTPTFVLMDKGRELGRITGYADNATFWGLLEQIMADRPQNPSPSLSGSKS